MPTSEQQRSTLDHAEDSSPKWRRLPSTERKSAILEAARRAFIEAGDVNGTTIRVIAEKAGVSEGLIYRHFSSKEQLFIEAVLEPLQQRVDKLVAASEVVDRAEPLTPRRQKETMEILYRQLIATFTEVLPLLGLVLFSDPAIAQKFYRENFSVSMDQLGAVWNQVLERYGTTDGSSDITARAVMGTALILALESFHNTEFDLDRAIRLTAEGYIHGFFPTINAKPRGKK
jgi:AcrR family transcriptional regulator